MNIRNLIPLVVLARLTRTHSRTSGQPSALRPAPSKQELRTLGRKMLVAMLQGVLIAGLLVLIIVGVFA